MEPSTSEFPFDAQTWLVSDTHFFHANIGRYCNRPDGWQEMIIANWNLHIQPGNIVFHLGDLAFGRKENMESLAPQLNGRLYLLRGNHDRRGIAFYRDLGITLVRDPYSMETPDGKRLIFSHRPIIPLVPGLLNLHGHIHNNATTELGPRHINLSIEVRQYRPWKLEEILRMSPSPGS
ncbi:MAG: metallophosphoesterase [Anaerolineales bacterium]|nr:metallophosphoesterase [Anaerolineales bacterium]